MQVLLVSQRYPPARLAGSELQVQLLANALASRGIQPRVLTTMAPGSAAPEEKRVPVDTVNFLGWPLRRVSQWALTRRHLAASPHSFDLVHCHCISPTSLAAVQHFRRRGVPVLLQASLGGPGGEFDGARFLGLRHVINDVIRSATAYPVLNEVIRHELTGLGVAEHRLLPVHNGVDLARFKPVSKGEQAANREELGLPEGPVVLYVGQMVERKGVHDLLSVWPAVRGLHPSATLALAGSGPLDTLVAEFGRQEPSVCFLGEREDVSRLMQAADVFVTPSYNESFGCALIEAMACGLPVVAGRTGIADVLPIDGQAGSVITPGDRVRLREVLCELLSDVGLRARYSFGGPRLVLTFDINSVADEVVAMYRTVRG